MKLILIILTIMMTSCSSHSYKSQVRIPAIKNVMGSWYVQAGRFTFLEHKAYNAVETYSWNSQKKQIDVLFTFRRGSFNGKEVRMTQIGWVENQQTNSHWKIRPFWPLKLDYLIVNIAKDYSWIVVGVPNQKYMWLMTRDSFVKDSEISQILKETGELGYDISNIERIPQSW